LSELRFRYIPSRIVKETNNNMEHYVFVDLIVGVASGLITAVLSLAIRTNASLVRSWFDSEMRRQAAIITGRWIATETFADLSTKDIFTMDLKCRGRRVTGTLLCTEGYDKNESYEFEGVFRDLILTFMWKKKGKGALESGTVTARIPYPREGVLEGYGLYFEPDDGKVYASTFNAEMAKS
jgi:hypothetical protein